MFLEKLFNRIKLKYYLRLLTNKKEIINDLSLLKKVVTLIDYNTFDKYKPNDSLNYNLMTDYENLSLVIEVITASITLIEKDLQINLKNSTNLNKIKFDRFLTISNGYYISINDILNEYRNLVIELCKLFENINTSDAGIKSHNLRLLTKLFLLIKEITVILALISFNLIDKD